MKKVDKYALGFCSIFFASLFLVIPFCGPSEAVKEKNTEVMEQKNVAEQMANKGHDIFHGKLLSIIPPHTDCGYSFVMGFITCDTSSPGISYQEEKDGSAIIRFLSIPPSFYERLNSGRFDAFSIVYREVVTPDLHNPKYRWGCLNDPATGSYTCWLRSEFNSPPKDK